MSSLPLAHLSASDVEELVVVIGMAENLVEMVAVGIGDKNLSEPLCRYELHDLLHTLSIKFVEDVVKKQQWCCAGRRSPQEVELRQFQRQHIGLGLPLAALAPHGKSVDEHLQIIAVDAMEAIAHSPVAATVALDDIEQRTTLAVRDITQRHRLVTATDTGINLLKDGDEFLHKLIAFGKDLLALRRHLFLPQLHELHIWLCLSPQQSIALLKGFVVAVQRINILVVILCDDDIHEPAPLLARPGNKTVVRRRDEDERNKAYMLRELLILLVVALEMLMLPGLHGSIDTLSITAIGDILTLDDKELLAMGDDKAVHVRETGMAEGEIIDGIKKISLAHAIASYEAVELGRQRDIGFTDILVVDNRNLLKYHNSAKLLLFMGKKEKRKR